MRELADQKNSLREESMVSFLQIARSHHKTVGIRKSLTIYIVASVVSGVIVTFGAPFSLNGLQAIIASLAIFCALLFSLLIPSLEHYRRAIENRKRSDHESRQLTSMYRDRLKSKETLAKGILSACIWSICLSLAATVTQTTLVFLLPQNLTDWTPSWLHYLVAGLGYFLTASFLFHLPLVLHYTYASFIIEAEQ